MSLGFPRVYTSFAEFERDELRRLESLHTSVDDLVGDKPHHCHRRLVAEYLRKHWGNVEIAHLG